MKQEMFEMLFALLNTPRLEWKVIFMTGSIFCAAPLLISHFISASETHLMVSFFMFASVILFIYIVHRAGQ